MSMDFSIRPAGSPAPAPVMPPANPAAGQAVATELPANQSVTAIDGATAVRNDPFVVDIDLSHQAFYDRAAGSVVYQVVDETTAQVVDQYPNEAVLRRRAYFRAMEVSGDEASRGRPIDRSA